MSSPTAYTTDYITGYITKFSHDGRGITHVDGKLVFVRGALPDERIRFRIVRRHARFDEAEIIDILEPSPTRQPPRCPHFGTCGGCDLQHMSTAAQLAFKQRTVLELLQRTAHVQPKEIVPALEAEVWGYRRKARLGITYLKKTDKMLVGFREKNKHCLVDLTCCETLHPRVGQHLDSLHEVLYSLRIREYIPHIEVAVDDHCTALIIRHLVPMPPEDCDKLILFAKSQQYTLYLQPAGIDSIHLLIPQAKNDKMSYSYPNSYPGLQWTFHPSQFTQVHTAMNHQIINQVLHWFALKPQDRVLDLFCGIGNFTLAIGQVVEVVIGVEGCPETVKQARENAIQNQLHHVQFYTENLFAPPFQETWSKQQYDYVLLDPPRTGAQAVIPYLQQWYPKKIIYISCNPSTLARDTHLLVQQGYALCKLGIANMFPQTRHIEMMTLFEREKI